RLGLGAHRLELEPRSADYGVDVSGEALANVRGRSLRRREVDHHIRAVQKVGQASLERWVRPSRELQVVGLSDGLAHRLPHAPRGARDDDANHAAANASLTDAVASLKRSSWGPMHAAESRSGS